MTRQPGGAGADTPLMQQYRDIKRRHADAVLFFRMGDFYEMFFDDARLAARELGLTLTSRNNGGAADVPLAGVPVKAAAEYVRRLVARGHRVAICEQVEDPRLAKGVVRRAVIETVTPGAVLADDLLDGVGNNFLVSAAAGDPVGLAALDISTGDFVLETVAPADLSAALARYAPRELVVGAEDDRLPLPDGPVITRREGWEYDAALGAAELERRFGLAHLGGLDITDAERPALAAASALLLYVRDLQPGGLPQLKRPLVRRAGGTMLLDEMTRRNLELVEPLRPGDRDTTLLGVIDHTVTPMGARLIRQWLLAPLRDLDAIRARHDAVGVLAADGRGRERLRDALDGVRDVERLAGRAAARRASPRDLGGLRDSLQRLPDVSSALGGLAARDRSAELDGVAQGFDLMADLAERLAVALVDRPPATLDEGESIRAGVDAALDEQRQLRDGGKEFIAGLQARERERTGITSLKVGYNRVFGYYLEVSKANRRLVPAHYERRQTLTGAERYVTPELKEYESRVLAAEELAQARERELFEALCDAVRERLGRLQRVARDLATLDVYAAFAEGAARDHYVRPTMTEEPVLDLRGSRHPVVERRLARAQFIPNDILLDEAQRVILLTGPNMAGKSTILRQAGLAVILAQAGAFVPADAATMRVVDRVFTRVGASDNLGLGHSTFMVEMSETSAILNSATPHSLVLLDEIGRGTATYDGVAIAWAVTEHLHDRVGAPTIFATHYHELTQLTEELAHARNFNVAVRESGHEIGFLYRLEPGGADRSYGIHVGKLAGLPPGVVQRATEILAMLEAGHHVAGRVPPPAPDARQLTLFETPHPVIRELQAMDPDRLTPLEALSRLAALKRQAEER
ncbi:MAG TPA: DNA mismatch repair protein MutS [Gemmatimonadales bacterium]|nr:DNA mismatch repair protein MutS [Gemmatimonadales bacterium]